MAINKRKILESAQKYFQKGAYDKALKEYRALLEADPRDSNVRLKVGDIHLRVGQKEEAIAAYLKVAHAFMHDGFDAKAVALFKQITKIDPERTDVGVSLAELYQRLGLTSEAVSALQTAADALHKQGRKREALELLRKMASFDPTNTTSRLKVADLLKQADLHDEALAEYEEVAAELERQGEHEGLGGVWERMLELDPRRQTALLAMARHLLATNTPERALALARRAVELYPDVLEGWELLAESQRGIGRTDEMEETYRRLAELYRGRGDEDRARAILQRFVAVEPLERGAEEEPALPTESPFGKLDDQQVLDDPALHFEDSLGGASALSAVSSERAAPRQAEPSAPPRAPLPPPDVEPLDPEQVLAEASVYLRYGKHEKALASLESLLARDPNNRVALEKFGEALVAAGSPSRAVEAFSEAAKLARDAGDTAALSLLHDRLVELDPEAAARVAPAPTAALRPAPEPLVAPAPRPAPPPRALALPPHPVKEPEPELELDLDVDVDLDLEGAEPGEVAPPAVGAREHAAPPGGDTLEDAAGVLGAELEAAAAGSSPAVAPAAPPAPAPAAVRGAPAAESSSSSSTTPQQILEDLEEADFYLHQGLLEESEAIYRRILAGAPGHPQALLRMGEIAAARGQDPSAASDATPPPSEVADADSPGADAADGLDELADELLRDDPVQDEAGESTDTETSREEGAGSAGLGLDLPDLEIDVEAPEEAAHAQAADTALQHSAQPFSRESPDEASHDAPLEPRAAAGSTASHDLSELLEEDSPLSEDAQAERPAHRAAAIDETAREVGAPDEAPFDLAAELSEAFSEEPAAHEMKSAAVTDDALAAVFREFKKGVSRTLSESDHETHYDLGIAYREMGLFEDAIGEFRVALESPKRRIDCLHMLGLCALDLKRPQDAVAHLEQALALPGVPELQQTAIRYDLGRAFESAGDVGRARAAYQAVAQVERDFQDVEERLARLAAGLAGSDEPTLDDGASAVGAPPAEAFESFDDLIAEAQETGEEEDAPPPPLAGGRSQSATETAAAAEAPKSPARRRRISFG